MMPPAQVDGLTGPLRAAIRSRRDLASERPFVTLAYAQSLDGCIASAPGVRTSFGGPGALHLTHALRGLHDGILVGIGTVLADDPRLTVRHASGEHPRPIVVDPRLRLPLEARLLQEAARPPLVIATPEADAATARRLASRGVEIVSLPASDGGSIPFVDILSALRARGVASLLIEGGAKVITGVLTGRLVDRVFVTIAPNWLGGLHAVGPLDSTPVARRPGLETLSWSVVDECAVVFGRPRPLPRPRRLAP